MPPPWARGESRSPPLWARGESRSPPVGPLRVSVSPAVGPLRVSVSPAVGPGIVSIFLFPGRNGDYFVEPPKLPALTIVTFDRSMYFRIASAI
jgi:hypothetical protein